MTFARRSGARGRARARANDAAPARNAHVSECRLEAKPERVWRALTTPEILSEWLLPAKRGGDGEIALEAPPEQGGAIVARVVEWDFPHRLTYAWRSDEAGLDSRVTFELTEIPEGTRLRVVHAVLAQRAPERRRRRAPVARGGRRSCPPLLLARAA